MTEIIQWTIGAIFAVLLVLFGIERRKTAKAEKRATKAEDKAAKLEVVIGVQHTANTVKDDLAKDKATLSKEKEEVIQSISDIPEKKEVELSEEVKKLAADQSARADAERVPVDRSKGSRVQNSKR